MRELQGYYRYWGKARKPGEAGAPYHLLCYHGLDVAAVGQVLLREQTSLLKGVAEFLGVTAEALRDWIIALLALHDIGKFADGFQNLRPDLIAGLQGREVNTGYDERHDTLGFRFLTAKGSASPLRMLAGRRWMELPWDDLRELMLPWVAAVAGHHGRPPVVTAFPRPVAHHFPPPVTKDAHAYLHEVLALNLPGGTPFDLDDYDHLSRACPRVSWLAAGIAVAADWLGSNEAWFPYQDRVIPLVEYWEDHAVPQAETAVAESGLLAAAPAAWSGLRTLFPKIETLTPLQGLAERVSLSDYPQLFVIEEVTGGGKTEAALTLAHRLMARGAADGVYLALPTMATANAMHRRVEGMYRRLFADKTSPSLVLAHSASRLAQVLALEDKNRPDAEPRGGETASTQCSAWLADSRKKALLAQVGVGTIDQALLAILAARHQSMRLFGLCRKVLIVDEVHACDAYVHRLLCTLLRFHAALGGSAILLSATIPARMRRELVAAFDSSLGSGAVCPANADYPLVTHLTAEGCQAHPVEARESVRRRVGVQALSCVEEVDTVLTEVVESGGCACWVRNTVDDAVEVYRQWVARLGEDRVTLFHARFALGDRLALESEVLHCFGPDSTADDRRGRLLIATQVVEQSLDLDFDGMVSDLAPIDLLIQRAGRLKRHARDEDGNRTEGQDLRGPPELGVFMPEPVVEPDTRWFSELFPRAAWVYEDHGQLWLTARWLQEQGGFAMPEDARDMIESVYGEESQSEIPEGLRGRTQRAVGNAGAMAAQGRLNSLDLDEGYVATATHWQDDASAPTRLGDPTTTVRLARWDDGRLIPWIGGQPRHAWQLSQLTVRKSRIAGEAPGPESSDLEAVRNTMPDRGEYCVVLILKEAGEESWTGRCVDGAGTAVNLGYGARLGLQFLGGGNE